MSYDYRNRPPVDLIDRIKERSLEAQLAAATRGVVAPPPSWLDVDMLLAAINSRDIALAEAGPSDNSGFAAGMRRAASIVEDFRQSSELGDELDMVIAAIQKEAPAEGHTNCGEFVCRDCGKTVERKANGITTLSSPARFSSESKT